MLNTHDNNKTDEQSPLVSPVEQNDAFEARGGEGGHASPHQHQHHHHDHQHERDHGHGSMDQSSRSTLYLILLTLSIGGLQVVWSVELSNGSPYLLSLGMSKALLAFVWVAGPLTGALVQPYIGIRSDNCRISWGRRKPFMVFGGLATIAALLLLAWIREIIAGVLGIFGAAEKSQGVHITTLALATVLMYCLDFAINTVQAGIRAFIVDNAPAHQQETANAWASRLTGIGNIIGYILGYMDLPKTFPFLGNTQFKVLCVISTSSLAITLLISCLYIKERDPRLNPPPPSGKPGLIAFFKQVIKSARSLPPQIRKVCEVQLAAWVGWFPFLFYSTTYIGQLYVNPIFEEHPDLPETEVDRAWEDATRIGTFALLINAIITLASNIILPVLTVPSYGRVRAAASNADSQRRRDSLEDEEGTTSEPLLEGGHPIVTNSNDDDNDEKPNILKKLRIPGLTLRRTWLLSHLLFALCMLSTFFITSTEAATVVLGVVGISWAVTLWAPFALISAEVAQSAATRQLSSHLHSDLEPRTTPGLHEDEGEGDDIESAAPPKAEAERPTVEAGVVLGLHNVAICLPQFISTLVSSLIFKALQKPRGEPWDESVGWVMRFGGAAALVASASSSRRSFDRKRGYHSLLCTFAPRVASSISTTKANETEIQQTDLTMAANLAFEVAGDLLRRATDDSDPEDAGPEPEKKEFFSSWALLILIMLLICALFTSYILQQRKIQAVHETVLSIFAGMFVGLILRLSPTSPIQESVTFDYQFFFNLLLPPIILASGYELHQANFFRNIGTILTFAFAGTFISAIVLGLILYLWTRIPLDGLNISLVEAISVGATLSATDPVTILAIFNLYKVEPKLYTIIFGESILNDAVAIVLFDTAQKYAENDAAKLSVLNLFEAIGLFLLVFFGSMVVGIIIGIATALGLKYTHVRRMPKIESCLIVLIAYASYFFSNGVFLSGIVSLLFCGITLKHYAYYNMSRRTQLTTKYLFQVMSQLSENFIFIYLGLDLFVETHLQFKPLFIIVAVLGICFARYLSVFPLSKAVNWFIRYRARRRGKDVADEIPFSYQAMLFWAGLRGAVGVALAAGISGVNAPALRATVLVVVVLTVIIFGGTTARMLEILGIRTGVVEEVESDDEFDIEVTHGGTYYKRANNTGIGYTPRRGDSTIPLENVNDRPGLEPHDSYSSGNNRRPSPPSRSRSSARRGTLFNSKDRDARRDQSSAQNLLSAAAAGNNASRSESDIGSDEDIANSHSRQHGRTQSGATVDHLDEFELDIDSASDDDLPPAVPSTSRLRRSPSQPQNNVPSSSSISVSPAGREPITARNALRELFSGGPTGDHAEWFRQLDEDFIKPTLLLDQSNHKGPGAV
ncbi:putative Na(+)/H(+) antiporter C15A10,06 [Talaromyces islandicus]|uniref:Sodium/hydrogen exchanger n=1 Tax=Talaromyces islandicus TaxID=28573 RepID=A0A0U1LZ50_TALIS|nr:putative Na(+)/H(+) antiporter C15A10,06 [Talaromyces islandicus]